jgi:hypothetical protein
MSDCSTEGPLLMENHLSLPPSPLDKAGKLLNELLGFLPPEHKGETDR